MIKINLKEHENMIDAYAELERVMIEEREGQLQELARIKGVWKGPAATALQMQYPTMLTSGAYQIALEQVTGMRQAMEEVLPELKRLKRKCESFPACIGGTAGNNTTGILMLDETVIPTIDEYCDTIKSNSDQLKSILQAIMDKCGGLVDFGEDYAALDLACRKMDKIIDLKAEIDDYKKCVEDLDADLTNVYNGWLSEEVLGELEEQKIQEDIKASGLDRFKNLLMEIRKTDVLQYERAKELLQCNAYGIYGFERVLQQDEIEETDIYLLAAIYEDVYMDIYMAETEETCQEEMYILNRYLSNFFEMTEETEMMDMGVLADHVYVTAKKDVIDRLLTRIEDGYASDTLSGIRECKIEVQKSWFDGGFLGIKNWGEKLSELEEFRSADFVGVGVCKTDVGVRTYVMAYPESSNRESHADEGIHVVYEKQLYELDILDRCARTDYKMTLEEEKEVEALLREYFKDSENRFARDMADNLGINSLSYSTRLNFSEEKTREFEQMYLLYRKTDDVEAFSYGLYSNFILTKPFVYGGIVDKWLGYPDDGTGNREYIQMSVEQNKISCMAGGLTGQVASYKVGASAMKAIPGIGAGLTKAGESLSKVPVLSKAGAESITNVLADTTLDTAIDTIPGMAGVYANGGDAGDIALEGVKRTGMNLAMNVGSEAIFRAGSAVIEKVNTVEYHTDVKKGNSAFESGRTTVIYGSDDIANYQYNMIENPGPLAEMPNQPAKNFYGGRYNMEVLQEDRIMYRAGNAQNPYGRWFTSEPPASVANVRIDTAVKTHWIDPKTGAYEASSYIDNVYAIKIPKGTTIYTGPVGPQGGVYVGGYNVMQTYIDAPWTFEVVGKTPLQ